MSAEPNGTAESVPAIREPNDPALNELTQEELDELEAEVAEMHRLAEADPKVGH